MFHSENRGRSEAPPSGIIAHELGNARHEDQAKKQPPDQPDCERPRLVSGATQPEFPGHHENRQQACLEQEAVPLITKKNLASHCDREICEPEQYRAQPRHDSEEKHGAAEHAAPAKGMKGAIGRVEPEHARQKPIGFEPRAKREACLFEELGGRQDSVRADQSVNLCSHRAEGGEVSKPEPAQEYGPCVSKGGPRLHRGLGIFWRQCLGFPLHHCRACIRPSRCRAGRSPESRSYEACCCLR